MGVSRHISKNVCSLTFCDGDMVNVEGTKRSEWIFMEAGHQESPPCLPFGSLVLLGFHQGAGALVRLGILDIGVIMIGTHTSERKTNLVSMCELKMG